MQTRDPQEHHRPLPGARLAFHRRIGELDPLEPRIEQRIRMLGLTLGVEILDIDETVVDAVSGWNGVLTGGVEEMWRHLVHDPCPFLRLHAAVALGDMLMRADPLSATWLVTTWSSADEEPLRLAIARALHSPVQVVGANWALDYLADDGSMPVRRTARGAQRVRSGVELRRPLRAAAAH